MDVREQIIHFGSDLDKLVDRYRKEYDLPYAAVLGMMQMKCHLLIEEAFDVSEEDQADG